MIKSFNEYIKDNYNTGLFNYNNMPFRLEVDNSGENTHVKILFNDIYYEDLSVDIPESSDLDKDEFFANPKTKDDMVYILVNQGFIEETNKEAMAGDKKTKSYKLV